MKDLNQLLLNFEYKQNFKDEDFYVSSSNYYVFKLINSWPKWEKNFLNICGEKSSGKSHLANIFYNKNKGKKINENQLNEDTLREFKLYENIILDDFKNKTEERLLYSLFNLVDHDNKYLSMFRESLMFSGTELNPQDKINNPTVTGNSFSPSIGLQKSVIDPR